jgi:competence protein ComEC
MPLLWVSLAFLCGILLEGLLEWPPASWIALAGVAILAFGLRYLFARIQFRFPQIPFNPLPVPLPLLVLVVAAGAARYQLSQPRLSPDLVTWYNDLPGEYVVEGVLVEPPDVRDQYINLRVEIDRLHLVGETLFTPTKGLLLAQVPPGDDWRYGDRLRLTGRLQTPFETEDFSYRDYLANQGVYTLMPRAAANLVWHNQGNWFMALVYGLRQRAFTVVYTLFPDPEASLLAGILLGLDNGIPPAVQEAFNATGTAHIIAISGFNITILSGLLMTVFARLLGPRRGCLLTIFGVAAYTLLVGAGPSVVRAAIMGGLSLFARQVGRRQDGLNSLGFVAALMAAFNPRVLWDVSFQLSFTATLGLVLYADPLTQAFVRLASWLPQSLIDRLVGPVGEYFLFTLAAQLTSLPVIIYHFGRLSLISLVANPAVLPAQPAVEVLGGLSTIFGLVYLPAGRLAAALAWPFLAYTIRMVEFLAQAPGAVLPLGRTSLGWVAAFYCLLFVLTFIAPRLRGLAAAVKPSLAILIIAAITVVVWKMALAHPDGRLHLTLLDVGGGEAILIQSPEGRHLLIDGGPSHSRLSDALGRRLPLFQHQLDYLLVSPAEEEYIAALPDNLERFPPAQVLWSGPLQNSRSARSLQELLAEAQAPVQIAQPGQTLSLGGGAWLHVLVAGKRGMVLLLEWDRFRALLPLGLESGTLAELQQEASLGPVSALLLADNGYAALNPPEWIKSLNPQVILLGASPGGQHGLPGDDLLNAIATYPLLRTDRNGWIEVSTDGNQMWVEVEK